MKKALSVLLLCFVLLGICSCQKKIITDPEEYSKYLEESESKAAAESSQQQEKIEEDIAKLESELGKTEKNKQIVAKSEYTGLRIYEKVIFKKGKADYKLIYRYYDSDADYQEQVKMGDNGNDKLIDKDKSIRCLVYRNNDILEMDFDQFYKIYDDKDDNICQIIE
ncbi:MAG: hypothetical protein IK097_05045 [Clostridia bacterium]|nr:hypothetical protein [Clostridia bacterium]